MAALQGMIANEHLLRTHLWQLCTSPIVGVGVRVDRDALEANAPGWEAGQGFGAGPLQALWECVQVEDRAGSAPFYASRAEEPGYLLPVHFFLFANGPADLVALDLASMPLLFTGCESSPYGGWVAMSAPCSLHVYSAQGMHGGVSATWDHVDRGWALVHFLSSGLIALAFGDENNGSSMHLHQPVSGVLRRVLVSTMAQLDELDACGVPWRLNDLDEQLLDSREAVLRCLRHLDACTGGHDLALVSARLKDDPEVAHAAIACHAENYGHLSQDRQLVPALAMQAALKDPEMVRLIPAALLTDRAFAEELVQAEPRTIHALPRELLDRELVALAGATHPEAYAHDVHAAPPGFFQDRANVLRIVRTRGRAIELLDAAMIDDEEVMLAALRNAPSIIAHLHALGLVTRERVLRWVAELPGVLAWLPAWADDTEIGLCAVRKQGSSLEHLSQRLRNDRQMVLEACARDIMHVRHAGAAVLGADAELRDLQARASAEEDELPF